MLPIYTRYLTPADYGAVELLGMALEITGILVGLRISQAMFRYYILENDNHQKKVIVSTVLLTVIIAGGFGSLLLYAGSNYLVYAIFGNLEYLTEFKLFALTLVTNAISAAGLSYLRARQKPLFFVSVGIASLAIQVMLNIYFVVHLELHVRGVVYSAMLSGAIVAVFLSMYVIHKTGFHYSREVLARLVRFIAPLIIASIGAFYVAYADKYFIRIFTSLADVGIYSLAVRVSSVLSVAFEAFNMSWGADRFEIVKRENARIIYEKVFRILNMALILTGAGLSIFARDFFYIMTHPEFYPAGNIVPIMVMASIVRIYTTYCNFGALYNEQTRIMAEASWSKAAVSTVFYLTLIPSAGIMGAALAILFGNLIEFIWVHKKSSKLYNMGLDWKPVLIMLSVALLCVVFGATMAEGSVISFAMRCTIFIVLAIAIWLLPFWKDGEKEMIISLITRSKRSSGKIS